MVAPIDLNLVRAFVGVHETGSFSAAAARLHVPRSTISRAVSTLEEQAGVRLFHRTTRKVMTTEAGLSLFDRVAPSLSALEASLTDLPEDVEVPSGTLRLTTSLDLATTVVAQAVARFRARYPQVDVDVQVGGKVVDLIRERLDVALRFSPGPLKGASIVARKLGNVSFQLYASPAYLARRGAPRDIADLDAHDWVGMPGAPLRGAASHPSITCDDKFFAREVLRAGGGIGLLPSYLADADLLAGTLERVLPRWSAKQGAYYFVQPSRKHVPRRVSAFRDLLLELLRQRPLDAETP